MGQASTKSLLGIRNPEIRTSEHPRAGILGPRNKDNRNLKSQESTERVADYLVYKFQSPEYKNLFLKVAWRLDRGTIDRLVGTSFEMARNPRAYFTVLARQEMSK